MDLKGIHSHAKLAVLISLHRQTLLWVVGISSAGLAVAFLGAAFSLRQPLVVGLDLALSFMRLLLNLMAILWAQEMFAKDIERRTLIPLLVLPSSRAAYTLGRQLGLGLILLTVAVLWIPLLMIAGSLADWGYTGSTRAYLDWHLGWVVLGILLDALVVAAFVQFISALAITPIVPVLAGMAFALATKMIGPVMDYLEFSGEAYPDIQTTFVPMLRAFRWFMPELSRLDWREVVLYGAQIDVTNALTSVQMACGYVLLFGCLSVVAYDKKDLR